MQLFQDIHSKWNGVIPQVVQVSAMVATGLAIASFVMAPLDSSLWWTGAMTTVTAIALWTWRIVIWKRNRDQRGSSQKKEVTS